MKWEESYYTYPIIHKHSRCKVIIPSTDIGICAQTSYNMYIMKTTKDDLLAMEYTEVLRSEDPEIRQVAKDVFGIRRVPILPEWKLKRHQIEILQWLFERENTTYMNITGGIVAADMGLGKTLTASVHSLSRPRGRNPTLIVCSKTLMASWKADLTKFLGDAWVTKNVIFLHRDYLGVAGLEKITSEEIRNAELVITAYPACSTGYKAVCDRLVTKAESSHTGLDVLYDRIWTRIILDESQTIANPITAMYSATRALRSEKKICLTGTPVKNVDQDILSQLLFLGIRPVPSAKAWDARRFYDLGLDRLLLSMDYEYADVKLPDKDDYFVTVKMSPEELIAYKHVETRAQEIYDEMEKNIVKYHCVLEMLLRLRQFCLAPYLTSLSSSCTNALAQMGPAISDSKLATWLTDKEGTAGLQSAKTNALMTTLEGLSTCKVVVFSYFSGYLNLVGELLTKIGRPYFLMDGKVKVKDRAEMVRRFTEEDKPWVLLLNYKIGSEGLNLQACSNVIFTDLCWNAAGMQQAAKRVWRLGQNEVVHCYYLLIDNSVESRMMEICQDKGDIMKEYLSGETAKLDRDVIGRILGRARTTRR